MQPYTLQIEPKTILSTWQNEAKLRGYHHVQLSHFGPLSQDLINSFTVSMEEFMISAGDKKALVKRVFSILIEGLQNILIHGTKIEGDQNALIFIAYNEQGYYIVLGNLTQRLDHSRLIGYLDKLNGMNDEEVKAFYLETLNNGLISDKGGAGLGFITIRMKSKSKLQYSFSDLNDDLLLFSIATEIAKFSE
jgi:hypothetical protein